MADEPKLRAIGRRLKDEESRFIGYAEIEQKSRELGFGMTVRTLRFYVDEGILPPPKKVGKTPVYEEDWILNVLLAIHLMKTRLNRSLTEVRSVIERLREEPAHLADKLAALYEESAKETKDAGEGSALAPVQRQALVDAFFGLLLGRIGQARQASEVRLVELIDCFRSGPAGEQYAPPTPAAIIASQQTGAPIIPQLPELPAAPAPMPTPIVAAVPAAAPAPEPIDLAVAARMVPAARPALVAPEPELSSQAPQGAVTVERARAIEETFVARFEANFERMGRVLCPLDQKAYKAGPRERSLLKRDRAGEVVDLMKRHRVFDRSLLDVIPLDATREFQVFQRGLFGRGDLKVVVTAMCLSPLDQLVRRRWADAPLGPLDVERAIEGIPLKDDVFHYVGLLSTVGWTPECKDRLPTGRNLLVSLIESAGGTAWRRHLMPDPRWGGVERVFDPETDREKVERVRDHMREHLKPKGEFLIISNLVDDLDLAPECVRAALDEVMAEDPELTIAVTGGREIVKRRRL
jgi:DNA-binding transcriptional MerR regulator